MFFLYKKCLFLSFTHFYWVLCPILTDLEEFYIHSATNPLSNFSLFVSCLVRVFMVIKKKINHIKDKNIPTFTLWQFFYILFKMSFPPPNVIQIFSCY